MPESPSRPQVIVAIVVALVLVGLGAMLLVGLLSGDDVDREENPVRGISQRA